MDAIVGGDELTLGLADELELLAPHGFGNRQVTLLLHAAEVVAPRLTRDKRHAQYRVRCDGASCQAIHFNFDALDELTAPGRHDVALALSKNEYNGSVSAQVQVRGLHRLEPPETDLCATACDLGCRDRLRGERLWAALLDGVAALPAAGDGPPGAAAEAAAALHAARAAGRILDLRGRPAVSQLAALLAGGERTLVLVADVARRRPLLTRDVLAPGLHCSGAYVQAACTQRLADAAGAGVVMTTPDLALADPAFARSFAHVVLLDPPMTGAAWAGLAAAAPEAHLHALWGAGRGRLRGARPRDASWIWTRPCAASGRPSPRARAGLTMGSSRNSLGQEPCSRRSPPSRPRSRRFAKRDCSSPARTAATISNDPQSKVDATQTDAWRRWHNRYQTPDFLQTCLTAQL